MLENEPSLFIICDPFKVFADQFKVFKIVFYTGWSYFFYSKSNSKWALWAGQPAPHERVVSCFSARSPLMTQTPCDENNLRLPINSFIYILKTTWQLTCKRIFYTMEQFMQLLLSSFKENSRLFLQVFHKFLIFIQTPPTTILKPSSYAFMVL